MKGDIAQHSTATIELKFAVGGVLIITLFLYGIGCTFNPFSPKLASRDGTLDRNFNPRTIAGFFSAFEFAYAVKDTALYGQLLDQSFVFVYRDFESSADVIWARDVEMFTTGGLFRNTEILDLRWNSIIFQTVDSALTEAQVIRSFRLRLAFRADDVLEVTGNANLSLTRSDSLSGWKMARWRDESNF